MKKDKKLEIEERARRKAAYEKKRQALLAKLPPEEVAAIENSIAKKGRYVTYLLEDLKKAAATLPTLYPYHIDHDLGKGQEWIAELALSPFKRIETWTGIPLEALPTEDQLTGDQIERLVAGLDELWEAYNFIFSMDEALSDPVIRYRMYLDCWDDWVQYLPQSGFELEICSGDDATCRMGDDCFCLENPPDLSADELFFEDGTEEELPF